MTKRIWLFYCVLAVAVMAFTAANKSHAAESQRVLKLQPSKGVSLDLGANRAVAYFRPSTGICNVTVLLAPRVGDDGAIPEAGSRVTVPVLPGKLARVDTPEGKSLDVGCALGATSMTLREVERVAWSRARF